MRLAPSILSADFSKLGEEIRCIEKAGAHQLHLDVMDGHYVENLTFGPMVVEAVRRSTKLTLDVHLMIEQADRWIEAYSEAGADMIAVHPETLYHLYRTLDDIRKRGKKVGIAINPAMPLAMMTEILHEIDYAIIMAVNPGFGGQSFIPGSFERVRRLREMIDHLDLAVQIEIDGSIDSGNIQAAAVAGADVAVAGSAVFKTPDPAQAVRDLLAKVRN